MGSAWVVSAACTCCGQEETSNMAPSEEEIGGFGCVLEDTGIPLLAET